MLAAWRRDLGFTGDRPAARPRQDDQIDRRARAQPWRPRRRSCHRRRAAASAKARLTTVIVAKTAVAIVHDNPSPPNVPTTISPRLPPARASRTSRVAMSCGSSSTIAGYRQGRSPPDTSRQTDRVLADQATRIAHPPGSYGRSPLALAPSCRTLRSERQKRGCSGGRRLGRIGLRGLQLPTPLTLHLPDHPPDEPQRQRERTEGGG